MKQEQIDQVLADLKAAFPEETDGIAYSAKGGDFYIVRRTESGFFRQMLIKERSGTIGLWGSCYHACRTFVASKMAELSNCRVAIPVGKEPKGDLAIWFNAHALNVESGVVVAKPWYESRMLVIRAAREVYDKLHEWNLLGEIENFCQVVGVEPKIRRHLKIEEECLVTEESLSMIPESLKGLKKWNAQFNIFDFLKISRMEIRHSNVLAWLLDPNGGHGFGGKLLKEVVALAGDKQPMDEVLDSFSVYRETENIDILLVSVPLKRLVAIENKVGAREGIRQTTKTDAVESQLTSYYDVLERMYPDFEKTLVFLTPDGTPPTDERWAVVTYADVVKAIEAMYGETYDKADADVNKKVLIDNYIQTVKRKVLMQIDPKLKELCRELYNAHKAELDLIYDYGKMNYAEAVEAKLKELTASGESRIVSAGGVHFTLRCFDELFPVHESIDAWWGKTPYSCWVNIDSDKRRVCCSVGLWRTANGSVQSLMERILEVQGGKEWKQEKKWIALPWNNRKGTKSVNTNNWKMFSDETDEGGVVLSEAVETVVNDVCVWAEQMAAKLKAKQS